MSSTAFVFEGVLLSTKELRPGSAEKQVGGGMTLVISSGLFVWKTRRWGPVPPWEGLQVVQSNPRVVAPGCGCHAPIIEQQQQGVSTEGMEGRSGARVQMEGSGGQAHCMHALPSGAHYFVSFVANCYGLNDIPQKID